MARKIKIPNHIQKRERQELKRAEVIRNKRLFFLIVCEGEKTEPNYFESLKNALPKGVLDVKITGTGNNTVSLVRNAKNIRKQTEAETNRKIDKLWVVFDRDSFKPQSFNSAIQKCADKADMDCAWTNEAFELWYLLHFHYYNTGIGRAQYQDLIEQNFRSKGLHDYKYQKNSTEMFDLLEKYGSRENAVANAQRLETAYNGRQDYANHNPCTKVHKLVSELFGL
ncbi:MAG: RloB family protein [Tannerella sp.]|jgi:hypothetical protein|nr:RloB family protein [Tannerella sp.]